MSENERTGPQLLLIVGFFVISVLSKTRWVVHQRLGWRSGAVLKCAVLKCVVLKCVALEWAMDLCDSWCSKPELYNLVVLKH